MASGSALFANRFGKRLKQKYAVMAVRGMGLEPGERPFQHGRIQLQLSTHW